MSNKNNKLADLKNLIVDYKKHNNKTQDRAKKILNEVQGILNDLEELDFKFAVESWPSTKHGLKELILYTPGEKPIRANPPRDE